MANKKFSWNAKTPMTSPDMVANPVRWNPMDKEWKKRVEAMQLYNEDATAPWLTNEMKKTLRALRDRILTFGGDEVLLNTRDEDAEKVLERGQFFYGSKYMKKGEDCRCHQNAAYLWDANRGRCQIATGYALSEDGLWRQHSWVVQPIFRCFWPKLNEIISWLLLQVLVLVAKEFIRSFLKTSWILAI